MGGNELQVHIGVNYVVEMIHNAFHNSLSCLTLYIISSTTPYLILVRVIKRHVMYLLEIYASFYCLNYLKSLVLNP